MTKLTPQFLKRWSHRGFRVYDTNNVLDQHVMTLTGRPPSCHVKISLLKIEKPELRRIAFGGKRKRILDQIADWTIGELATAFDVRRGADATDRAFARENGAELGLDGKYIRTGPYLILLNHPEQNDDEDSGEKKIEISVYLSKDIRRKMEIFLHTGRANPMVR